MFARITKALSNIFGYAMIGLTYYLIIFPMSKICNYQALVPAVENPTNQNSYRCDVTQEQVGHSHNTSALYHKFQLPLKFMTMMSYFIKLKFTNDVKVTIYTFF